MYVCTYFIYVHNISIYIYMCMHIISFPSPLHISSHPALAEVTLAVVLGGRGKITKAMAAKYVLAQLAAAALAGLVPWRSDGDLTGEKKW